ncbi:hypothetical protein PAMP_000158 [Pampus punctatissimus]
MTEEDDVMFNHVVKQEVNLAPMRQNVLRHKIHIRRAAGKQNGDVWGCLMFVGSRLVRCILGLPDIR